MNIIRLMENKLCKIIIEKEEINGFFCKIPFPDEKHLMQVLMTICLRKENLEKKLSLIIKNEKKSIDLKDRLIFPNEEYNLTIIKIKEDKRCNI